MADKIAVLWDEEVAWDQQKPFGHSEKTNENYEIYSGLAKDQGLELFIGHFSWYRKGRLQKAWYFSGEKWVKKEDIEINGVYDKFKFDEETIEIKKQIQNHLPVLNSYKLEEICKDKLLTYQKFPNYVPETKIATQESIQKIIDEYGKAVLKPRYDFGGRGIKVVNSLEEAEDIDYSENYLVQGFIDSSSGIEGLDVEGMHDLRVIVIGDEIADICVREPSDGYLSNLNLGGSIKYIDYEDCPDSAIPIVGRVKGEFEKYSPRIFTVDLIFDGKNQPHILELNSKPGIGIFRGEKLEEPPQAMTKVIKTLKQL